MTNATRMSRSRGSRWKLRCSLVLKAQENMHDEDRNVGREGGCVCHKRLIEECKNKHGIEHVLGGSKRIYI